MLRAAIRNNKSTIRQNVAKTADRNFSLIALPENSLAIKRQKTRNFAEMVIFVGFGLPKGFLEKKSSILYLCN